MRNYQAIVSLGLFVAGMGGCALDANSGSGEPQGSVGSTEQALSTYSQSFEETTQSIIFNAPAGTVWVDLHATLPGARVLNVRMTADGSSFVVGPLPVQAGDHLSYSFTYFVNGAAQDTPVYSYAAPAGSPLLALRTQIGSFSTGSEIQLISQSDLDWADVHYSINNGPQQNVRLTFTDWVYRQPISVHTGDTVQYWVTYSTGSFVADTAHATYTAVAGKRFVVDQSADSTTGSCVADGGNSAGHCNLRAALTAAKAAGGGWIELGADSTVDQGAIALDAPTGSTDYRVAIESKRGGSNRTISGNGMARLFSVGSNVTLSLGKVTVQNFRAFDFGSVISSAGDVELRAVAIQHNTTSCFGTGAMTAFATCGAGAISSSGRLTVVASLFDTNSANASASAASFTNASTFAGAISSSGSVLLHPPFTFTGNSAVASATSGVHPFPGGASASSGGGAIFSTGTLVINFSKGGCTFASNTASATAINPDGTTGSASSRGGAIATQGGTFRLAPGACHFGSNTAATDPDLSIQ